MYANLGIEVSDADSAHWLELIQFASAHTQLPLTDHELVFIARYPEQVARLLMVDLDADALNLRIRTVA